MLCREASTEIPAALRNLLSSISDTQLCSETKSMRAMCQPSCVSYLAGDPGCFARSVMSANSNTVIASVCLGWVNKEGSRGSKWGLGCESGRGDSMLSGEHRLLEGLWRSCRCRGCHRCRKISILLAGIMGRANRLTDRHYIVSRISLAQRYAAPCRCIVYDFKNTRFVLFLSPLPYLWVGERSEH